MRIIVVDDEPRQRKGMAELIKSIVAAAEVYSFKDGEQALDYAREYPVDIAFSDIRMPRMTGLEFAGQLPVVCPGVIVILVSVYADFEYARKAIELGAFGYILKPVSVDAVREILKKAVCKIEENKGKQILTNEKMLISALTVYQEHLFKKWMYGTISEDEEKELKTFIPTDKNGYIVYLCLPENKNAEGNTETLGVIVEWMKYYIKPGTVYCFVDEENWNAVVAVVFQQESELNFRMMMDRFHRNMKKELNENISIIAGRRFSCSGGDIQSAFTEIREASSLLFYGLFTEIQYQDQWPEQTDKLTTKDMELKKHIRESVMEADCEKAGEEMQMLLESFSREPILYPAVMAVTVSHLFLHILDGVNEFFAETDIDMLTRESIALKSCSSYDQMTKESLRLLKKIIEYYQRGKQNLSPIYQAITYIDNHYMEELSLNMLAQKYHYSPSYFSAIFKNVAGENLVSYINRIRIEKALAYMSVDSMKNREIAARVGMKDYKYFNRIFKRRYGISVQEYRKNLLKERREEKLWQD